MANKQKNSIARSSAPAEWWNLMQAATWIDLLETPGQGGLYNDPLPKFRFSQSAINRLHAALREGSLPAHGEIDSAPAAPVNAVTWAGSILTTKLVRLSDTDCRKYIFVQSATPYPQKAVIDQSSPADEDGKLFYRTIKNVMVWRADVERIWPAPQSIDVAGAGTSGPSRRRTRSMEQCEFSIREILAQHRMGRDHRKGPLDPVYVKTLNLFLEDFTQRGGPFFISGLSGNDFKCVVGELLEDIDLIPNDSPFRPKRGRPKNKKPDDFSSSVRIRK